MSSHFSILSLVTQILLFLVFTKSEVHYYITPSRNVPCLAHDPCLTLSQFADNSSSHVSNETNISLYFLPGNHSLDKEVFLLHLHSFLMTKTVQQNYGNIVFIECGSQSGRFSISETIFASIKDLYFIGCGGNRVSQVEQLVVEDTIFQGVEGRGTALILIDVIEAKIASTSCFSNAYSAMFPHSQGMVIYASRSSFSITSSTFANNGAAYGGVIYALTSSFIIAHCAFTDSNAGIGGVVYANDSEFSITNSTISNNVASYGGAIFTAGSLFNITNSTINSNIAIYGGVFFTFTSISSITVSTFSNNKGKDGGVIYSVDESSFNITNSTIDNNNALFGGGVLASSTSSFTIINTFINNNNAIYYGGVIFVVPDHTSDEILYPKANYSLVNIVNSSFSNNSAYFGGVVYTQISSFSITNSIFSVNCGAEGAVLYVEDSSFNITDSRFINNSADSNKMKYKVIKYTQFQRPPSYGGVMSTLSSSFAIINAIFTNNTAADDGGIIYAATSMFSVVKNTITNSRADFGGAIFATSNSSFNITNSTFEKNSGRFGGVIFMLESHFNTITSTFLTSTGSNGAAVIHTKSSSSFNIIKCILSNNSNTVLDGPGGAIETINSSFSIIDSIFNNNSAHIGGAIFTSNSSFSITSSSFTNNKCTLYEGHGGVVFLSTPEMAKSLSDNSNETYYGGVMFVINSSSFNVTNSNFIKNIAGNGGIIAASQSSFSIINCIIKDNNAYVYGGAIHAYNSSFGITNCTAENNNAYVGGVIYTIYSSFNITLSTFTNNSATNDRVPHAFINNSTYTSNLTGYTSGVIFADNSSSYIINSTFAMNSALDTGVINLFAKSSFNITSCIFTNNSADSCAVLSLWASATVTIINSMFTHNSANFSATISIASGDITVANSTFRNNTAKHIGIVTATGSSMYITNCAFEHNIGSLYAFSSNITFTGYIKFENCTGPINEMQVATWQEGGAITTYQSSLLFTGICKLLSNHASQGGALLAVGSTITVSGQAIVANNTAISSTAGGIYLYQSDLKIFGNCYISHNRAKRGGGIHASSSPITVHQQGLLQFSDNHAEIAGGGLYLDVNPRLDLLKHDNRASMLVIFISNHAAYGGAVYVADNTSYGCLYAVECFVQTVAVYARKAYYQSNSVTLTFSGNTASNKGQNLYGGLLDRCIPSPFAEVYRIHPQIRSYSAVNYLRNISNIVLDSISSLPVRVCFCNSGRQPNCSYQLPLIKVKKGAAFNVTLVAVDQVNHSVDANINSSLAFPGGGFVEGQQSQKVTSNCTDLRFNILSPEDSETLTLFPDGPCGSSTPSTRHLNITFLNCTCPIGFEPSNEPTTCECICDSNLLPYISDCNSTTDSLIRVNTNSWITYVNDTDLPGFVIHPNCPFDFCHSPTEKVNFSLPSRVDAQCAYNRTGVLCGACLQNLSLSLGSSRCLPCNGHWLTVLVTILIGSAIVGILLVVVLLVLNITVTGGFVTVIIFYANIIAASESTLIPNREPSFPSVLVAWLNLDIGFDLCFFDGLDTYIKIWLQLAFPVYIISLVIIVTKVSEHSPKFTRILGPGRRDPVATLATLTLLSYSKLLSTTIAALSYAVLHYPDGSKVKVWLPDGNLQYLRGKHIALAVAAFLIILVGVPYTLLLFFWQWLIRTPNDKLFKWTKDTRLNAIITTYHAPYNNKHRYWTGLLLLVRVVLYITAALFLSSNPQIPLLVTNILIGGLFFLKSIIGIRLYKVLLIDVMETVTLLNILCLSVFSLYNFKIDNKKQTAVAYTSTAITLCMLMGGVIYHTVLLFKRKKTTAELEEYRMIPLTEFAATSAPADVTYSIVECPTPEPPPSVPNSTDSDSDSISLENNDCQRESTPCEHHAAAKDKEDTVALLETM